MADPEQRERESRESAENKFVEAREDQREEVAQHADELKRMPEPEPEDDSD
jgi:hypothetical protein